MGDRQIGRLTDRGQIERLQVGEDSLVGRLTDKVRQTFRGQTDWRQPDGGTDSCGQRQRKIGRGIDRTDQEEHIYGDREINTGIDKQLVKTNIEIARGWQYYCINLLEVKITIDTSIFFLGVKDVAIKQSKYQSVSIIGDPLIQKCLAYLYCFLSSIMNVGLQYTPSGNLLIHR